MLNYFLALLEWLHAKLLLQNKQGGALFKEGEIWWCSIGMNIGVEIYGKGDQFTRPVIILKKFNAASFLGIPLTSQEKAGKWNYAVKYGEKNGTAILSQVRNFDSRRLVKKIMVLNESSVAKITDAFLNAYAPSSNIHPASSEARIGG